MAYVGHERLTDQQHERILTMLGHGDRHGDVTATYLAKEFLRDVYDVQTVRAARRWLRRFYEHCDQTGVRECRRLARNSCGGDSVPGDAAVQPEALRGRQPRLIA